MEILILNDVLDSSSVGRRRRTSLGNYCLEEELYDPWRCLRTTERDYTYFSPVHRNYSRIDFFLTDKYTLQKVTRADIHNITWPDHAPITIELLDTAKTNFTPLWRNNTYLLSQPQIQKEVNKQLEEYFTFNEQPGIHPTTVWCSHRAFSRGSLIQITAREKKKKTQLISLLHERIADLENKHNDHSLLKQLNSCREELRQTLKTDYDLYFKRLKLSYYSQNKRQGNY